MSADLAPSEQAGPRNLPSLLRSLRRVAGWGLADQALSSGGNFAVSLLVARASDRAAFGAFALAFSIYTVVLGVSRSLSSDPLLVRHTDAEVGQRQRASSQAVGTACGVGVIAAVLCIGIGISMGGAIGATLCALGLCLPALLAQDAYRFVLLARNEARNAAVVDACWTVIELPVLAVVMAKGGSVTFAVAVWGATAAVAAVVGGAVSRVWPDIRAAHRWVREHGDLGFRFTAEFLSTSGAGQIVLYALGVISGVVAIGSVRAAQVVLGPMNIFFLGASLIAVPEGVRRFRRSLEELERSSVMLSIVLGILGIIGGSVLHFLPDGIGRALVGETWSGAHMVVLPLALGTAAYGVALGAISGLRSVGAARRGLMARVLTVPVTIGGGVLGALLGGPVGAAYGLAFGNGAAAVSYWRQYRAELTTLRGLGHGGLVSV